MDNDVKEASMERVVIATDVQNASEAAELTALATPGSVSYRLKLKDGAREMERALELNGAATYIIAEMLLLDATEVWTSVRAGGAACLQKYVHAVDFPKILRPESAEARKSVVRCMRDELKDLEAGDIDLSNEEADWRTRSIDRQGDALRRLDGYSVEQLTLDSHGLLHALGGPVSPAEGRCFLPVEAGALITSSEWLLFLFAFFAIFSVFIREIIYNNQSCTVVRECACDESL